MTEDQTSELMGSIIEFIEDWYDEWVCDGYMECSLTKIGFSETWVGWSIAKGALSTGPFCPAPPT